MKLEKAIEILDININMRNKKMPPDVLDALELGIEALKRIQNARNIGYSVPASLLPSETPPSPSKKQRTLRFESSTIKKGTK